MSFSYGIALEAARMQVAPFINAAKVFVLILLLAGAMLGGCTWQRDIDEDKIAAAREAELKAESKYDRLLLDIEVSNNAALAAEERAKKLEEENERLAREASEQKKQKDKAAKEYQKKLEEAKRDPSCASLLEMKLCEAVSGY